MKIYDLVALLLVVTTLFAYVNFRFLKLPGAIGVMVIALLVSLFFVVFGNLFPAITGDLKNLMDQFSFSQLLLGSMLSFMLFAGAIHIPLSKLREQRLSVLLFSTISVVLSTFLIGSMIYFILPLLGLNVTYIHCLLFGSLISPTDPIAVLGILKDAKIEKSLEMKIAGESLFNDGVAVVVFLTIFEIASAGEANFGAADMITLFMKEALGGMLMGGLVGYVGYRMMKSIDNYKVEVLITLSIVMGGYSLANLMHVSGPLAMVVAGIITGNQAKEHAMSSQTSEYLDKFWELIDEILNAVLFVLIGFELLVLNSIRHYLLSGAIVVGIVLIARYISVWLPSQLIKRRENIDRYSLLILTWGGLRGGISVALALSLQDSMSKELWVSLTYMVVLFSIIVQGLTIGPLVKKRKEASG